MSSVTYDWKFCQVFGEPNKRQYEEVTDVDIVSVVEFDRTGEFLAAGDRGGRVVIFERVHSDETPCEFRFYAEFQSHEPEFDYLKSLEIEEKINKIKWCRTPLSRNSLLLLTTNDKTIKLWKMYDKHVPQSRMDGNGAAQRSNGARLCLPSVTRKEVTKAAVARKVYANAHTYHINSISLNSDGESFLSADDLRINMWNMEVSDQSFNIVDIKPANMEELVEVITATEFHPTHCQHFLYSTSRGVVKLADMRESALCERHAKTFEQPEDPANKSFFSEIIASISDIKFSPDGRYVVTRDYMTLKVWDVNMERAPLKVIRLHDYLRPKLCDLYETDAIFDKMECAVSGDSTRLLTGSYHNYFMVYDMTDSAAAAGAAGRRVPARPMTRMKLGRNRHKDTAMISTDNIDYQKKALHVAWHPQDDIIAIGASNNLFLYATGPMNDDSEDSEGYSS